MQKLTNLVYSNTHQAEWSNNRFLLKMSLIMAKIGQNWSFSVMLGKKYEQPWFGSNLYFHSWDGDSFVHYIVHNALCTLHIALTIPCVAHPLLQISCSKFHIANCSLIYAYFLFQFECWKLHVRYCMFIIEGWTLQVAYCMYIAFSIFCDDNCKLCDLSNSSPSLVKSKVNFIFIWFV